MRRYVVRCRGRVMGTVEAPSDQEAACLVVTMWGSETTMQRLDDADLPSRYSAYFKNYSADSAGREAEILFKIGREP